MTLVRPPTLQAKWGHCTPTCPPLGLAYVAAALREAGHEVRIIDAVGEAVSQMRPAANERLLVHGLGADEIAARVHPDTEVLGVSCMFSHEWPLMREVIARLRRAFPGVPIVAGGEHVTALPEFSLESCAGLDYCVLGEGEETMVELARALDEGRVSLAVPGLALRHGGQTVRTPARARIRRIDDIPPPAWDLVPLERYLDNELGFGVNRGRSIPLLATRGCPYQCTFCSNPVMWTTRWVARDPGAVIEEMRGYVARYRAENFDFYDLTAIVKREWIVDFCRRMLDGGLSVTWQLPSGTRSEAIDAEVARLLYAAGCRNISYAPESGSAGVLRRIKKKIDLGRMKASMRAAVRTGINVKANIILGFPDETHKEVLESMRFIVAMALLGVHDISISPFSPYPGSELFEDMRRRGRLAALDDRYFYSLASYTDLFHTVSAAEGIGDRALGWYRTAGLLLFYAVSFVARPWRFVRTCINAFRPRQESRSEMWVRETVFRLTHARGAGAPSRGARVDAGAAAP
ncbi:MAG: B12-binding domain-containing radical SAM protein [Candidatus Rokubacteria bacterium]|nr:B12-binding domain-containing radical SAM protein [Candidatus Rokubacteria bacterium]